MNRSYYCELIKLIGGHVVLGHSFHSKFIPLNFDPLLKIDQWAFYYLVFCPPHTLLSSKCYNQLNRYEKHNIIQNLFGLEEGV